MIRKNLQANSKKLNNKINSGDPVLRLEGLFVIKESIKDNQRHMLSCVDEMMTEQWAEKAQKEAAYYDSL